MGEINIENRERPHPWRRFLAFCFDVAYMAVITNIIWLFVLNHLGEKRIYNTVFCNCFYRTAAYYVVGIYSREVIIRHKDTA